MSPSEMEARGRVSDKPGNVFRMCSELARTTLVPSRPEVPRQGDLLHVTSESPDDHLIAPTGRPDILARVAQRAPEVFQDGPVHCLQGAQSTLRSLGLNLAAKLGCWTKFLTWVTEHWLPWP